jgi:PAS domain S-box-containing protein
MSTSEIIDRVLDAARKAASASCLSLVTSHDGDGAQSWTAQANGCNSLAKQCVEAGTLACIQPNGSRPTPDGLIISSICSVNGQKTVLVGDSSADSETLEIVSTYLSLLLDNDRLKSAFDTAQEESDRRIAEVSTVYEIGQAINELDLDCLLPLITEKAAAVMNAQACSLLLRDFESDTLTIEASWGLTDDIVKGTRVALGEGIAGTVASTGDAMLLVDVSADPRFASSSVHPRKDIAGSICAPLKDELGRSIGVLNIRRHVPALPFTEEDLRLFCVFASQAALAICNAQLYSSLSQRIAEMSTVSDLLKAINSTLDIEDVLNQIADNIVYVVGFDRCCVYLLDPRANEFVAGIRRGYADGELPERVKPGDGTIGVAAKEGISIFERCNDRPNSGAKVASLATPIVVRDSTIGVVVVDNALTGKPMKTPDVDLLSTFVSQAGIAIENARLYEAMEEKYAELNVLFEHSKTISSAYGLQNVAHMSTAVARRAVPCDGCTLLLLSDKRTNIALQAASGIPQDVADAVRKGLTDEEVVEFIRELRSTVVIDYKRSVKYGQAVREAFGKLIGGSGSVLAVPLLAEDMTVGVFLLYRRNLHDFATGEIKLLSIIASQAAVVLKNALRYEQRMKRQVLDLSTLYEFSRRISSSSSLEEALDAILSIVSDLVDCDESVIYAIDHERDVLVATAAKCNGTPRRIEEQSLSDDNVMSWTIRERKAVVSPDISNDSRFEPVVMGSRPVRSFMSIPLMVQDEAVGVMCVCSFGPNLYSEDDVRMLSIIASQSAAIYKELEALAALTSYTDNILSSIAAGVVTLDNDGVVLTWNRAAETITSFNVAEVEGIHYSDVVKQFDLPDSDKNAIIQVVEKVRTTGKMYQGYKLAFHPIDQDVMYLNMSASVLKNSIGDPIGQVIIFEDITKEIKMEDEFRRMGELAAVGQLAASIAHELRNPLSSIKGAAQYLQKEYESEALISEFLGIIVDEVNGLSKLTTEFLEFARPMEFEISSLDVNDVVRKTLQLMSVHISESGVVLIDHLASNLPIIQADGKQLEHALRNIILNALQAMPEGGTISIRTKAVGSGVDLVVSDTGSGIPEEKLHRIFIPFFTTKTKGTGLGLSVVQKIVENHGGHIDVSSMVGQGTKFKISLPQSGIVRTSPPEADTTERRT